MSTDRKRKRKGAVDFIDIRASPSQSEDELDELSVSLYSILSYFSSQFLPGPSLSMYTKLKLGPVAGPLF